MAQAHAFLEVDGGRLVFRSSDGRSGSQPLDADGLRQVLALFADQSVELHVADRLFSAEPHVPNTDPYGELEFAVGSADDFHCFDYDVQPHGVWLHAVINSEIGSFIQNADDPQFVPFNEAENVALGYIDQALEWCGENEVGHDVSGWNQDPYYFVRAVAAAVDREVNGTPYSVQSIPRRKA